jgi:RNA polymerase sigma-70 factor (ECF subfamily)
MNEKRTSRGMLQVYSDRELVLQLQEGSLDALGELYDRHQNMVYRTALAVTGDTAAAADLLQDVFLRMHRFAERIDPERPLEPWLYRTTTNLTYTWVKRHKRWFHPLEDIVEWLSGGNKYSPAHITEKEEEWQDVRQAVSSLPVSQRMVVVLYYINDLSLQEMSEILEVPVGTIKSRLFYGRLALKRHLEAVGTEFREVQYEFT